MGFSLPFKKKEQIKEHYFGLYLTHEHAVGFVFEIIDGKASIIAKEMCKYSNSWENILEDIDKLISILESETDVHLDQSIFFVHSYMIDAETHALKNPFKDIIKNIAKELELKPLGYIEVHEAVKDHLQNRDQSPLNTVFIELDPMHVGVYVYKGGRLIMSEYLSRTTDLIDDVSQLMTKVHSHTLLPSKMIVYGMIKIDDNVEKLLHHSWDTELFIQAPRVELLKGEELYASLGSIFAQQMGAEGEEVYEDDQEEVMIKEEPEEEETFGFVIGKDIVRETDILPPEDDLLDRPASKNAGKSFPAFAFKNPFGGKSFKGMSSSISGVFKSISLPGFNYIWIVAPIVIIGLLISFEYFFHKAEVVVYMPAETAEKTVDLILPVGEETTLSLIPHAFSADTTEEIATTGKRDIGEKAKGQVYISNFDNVEKSFAAGTKLEAGGLTFTTDSDVRVASASSVTTGGAKQSGRAKVSATASVIGPESNIAEGKQLKIAGLSDALYVAVVDTAFKGGTRKQVRTVARKDLDDLKKALAEKAKSPEAGKIETQVEPDQELVKELNEVKVNEVEYSKEVAEEAETVSGKAVTETTYYTFDKNLMKKELVEELKTVAPSGFKLETQKVEYVIGSAKKNEASGAAMQIDAKATIIKDVPITSLQDTIALSFTGGLESKLKDQFAAKGFEMKKVSPPFVGLWTPFFKKNITVTISSK